MRESGHRSNLHDVEVYQHHETDKARLVSLDGDRETAVWVPKSQCEVQPTFRSKIFTLTAEENVLIDKGLV